MPAAIVALDFHPQPVGIRKTLDGTGKGIVKARPAATGVELVGRAVELRAAAPASEGALLEKIIVLAGEGRFGSFVFDYVPFFGGEGVHGNSMEKNGILGNYVFS